jgi:flavin-dependent dehydrogenase
MSEPVRGTGAAMPVRDLVVVGGGPAGLAVAIRARQAGLRVAVLERGRPPIDAACGEGILPDTCAELVEMGIEPDTSERSEFHGIRYLCDELEAEGHFGGKPAWGLRRTVLHAALARRAEALGADLRWSTEARGLVEGGIATESEVLTARVIVGADGRNSRVRSWAGIAVRPGRPDRHAVRRHFATAPWADVVEVYWAEQAEAYVTPVGPGQVGVALLWNGDAAGFDALLPRFPRLAARVGSATPSSRDRGVARIGARPLRVVSRNVALVGDAAGGVDPITGEGLSLAFREAAALVRLVAAGRLSGYERAHARIGRAPRAMARVLLLLERSARLRRGAVAALEADPALFSRLLAFHTSSLPARRIGLLATARLVARAAAGAPA